MNPPEPSGAMLPLAALPSPQSMLALKSAPVSLGSGSLKVATVALNGASSVLVINCGVIVIG